MKLGEEVSREDAMEEVEALSRVGLHENIIWCCALEKGGAKI